MSQRCALRLRGGHNLWLFGMNLGVVLHKVQTVLLICTINGLTKGQLPAARKGKAALRRQWIYFVLCQSIFGCTRETLLWLTSFFHFANYLFLTLSLGHAFDYSVSTVLILCLQVIMYHSDFLVLKSWCSENIFKPMSWVMSWCHSATAGTIPLYDVYLYYILFPPLTALDEQQVPGYV